MTKSISIEGAVRFGWDAFKREWGFLVPTFVLLYILSGASDYLSEVYFKDIEPTSSLLSLVTSMIMLALYFNLIRAFLSIVDGHSPKIADLFVFDPGFLRYIGASILYGLVVMVGFLFFIIPGIFFYLRYGMYGYLIADRKLGIIDSLRESARITNGAKWQLLFMGIVTMVLLFLGALALGIGLFVAIPVIGLAYTSIYRSLLEQTESQVPAVSTVTPPAIVPPRPMIMTPSPEQETEEKKG